MSNPWHLALDYGTITTVAAHTTGPTGAIATLLVTPSATYVSEDGTISFLEVNTRLQVEHPVTEEVTGIDLVSEMLRIADGEELGYDDPIARGHSFEFRINGEDAGRNFMPAPGTVTKMRVPHGPGVRWDAGIEEGDTVAGAFDSMIAKLIVTGATRQQALERSRRALDELVVDGMPTVVPFHQAIVRDPAFAPEGDAPFSVYTRWIETEWNNTVEPFTGGDPISEEDTLPRQTVVVEVGGRRRKVGVAHLECGRDGGVEVAVVLHEELLERRTRRVGEHAHELLELRGVRLRGALRGALVRVGVRRVGAWRVGAWRVGVRRIALFEGVAQVAQVHRRLGRHGAKGPRT